MIQQRRHNSVAESPTIPFDRFYKELPMIHYSCDRCGKNIDPEMEIRYIVRIEVQATCDSPVLGDNEESDHLLELEEILERLEDADCPNISEDVYHRRKHDLCSGCYREYRKNPLALEPQIPIGFSNN